MAGRTHGQHAIPVTFGFKAAVWLDEVHRQQERLQQGRPRILVGEFIFTLAMALRCYPLQPGGLLAIEAVIIGMTNTETIRAEVFSNFPVILLLMFMVAGIYFMRELLLFTFTKLLLGVRSKMLLGFLFSAAAAFLSAFTGLSRSRAPAPAPPPARRRTRGGCPSGRTAPAPRRDSARWSGGALPPRRRAGSAAATSP